MNKVLICAIMVGTLISFEAKAQGRAGDAALGALSGAIVLGPVGAVAGAIVGYTAGPSIASSWGLRNSPYPRPRRARQSSVATRGLATQEQPAELWDAPSPQQPVRKPMPPVQGFD